MKILPLHNTSSTNDLTVPSGKNHSFHSGGSQLSSSTRSIKQFEDHPSSPTTPKLQSGKSNITNHTTTAGRKPRNPSNTTTSTGRGCCIDCLCSIRTIIVLFLAGSLFLTCTIIWIIMMVLVSQSSHEIKLTMGIVSIVVWCTFVVCSIVCSVVALLFVFYFIRKPLKELTIQLVAMKSLRFYLVREMVSNFNEFIPLFRVVSEMNNLMKDISPFIPESITGTNEEEEEQEHGNGTTINKNHRGGGHHQSQQPNKGAGAGDIRMVAILKSWIATSSSTATATNTRVRSSSVATNNGLHPHHHHLQSSLHMHSGSSLSKLQMVMSKAGRKSMDVASSGAGSDAGASFISATPTVATSGFAPPATTTNSFGLGLSSHITTTIVIHFRNFDGKNYPNTADIVSVFTLIFQKVQGASKQFKGRCTIITPKILLISFESGKNIERNALLCALQVEKKMEAINSQLTDQINLPPIQFGIGISRSECLVGNIGTSSVRFSALIGSCTSNALRLACLCGPLKTSILTDESLALAIQGGFLTRAVHFMQKSSVFEDDICLSLEDEDNKQTIFQLLGESKINEDEWLYEVQQQEYINQFKEIDRVFDLLRIGDVDSMVLGEICDVYGAFSSKYPDDRVVSLLYTQLTEISKLDSKEIGKAVQSLCLEKTGIQLQIEPSFIL